MSTSAELSLNRARSSVAKTLKKVPKANLFSKETIRILRELSSKNWLILKNVNLKIVLILQVLFLNEKHISIKQRLEATRISGK